MSFSLVDDRVISGRPDAHFQDRQEANALGLRELFGLLRRRFLLIAAIVVAVMLACGFVAYQLPKTFTARSMILLRPDDPNLLEDSVASPTQGPSKPAMDTETDLITSRTFVGKVVDKLNLVDDPNFNPFLPKPADQQPAAGAWNVVPSLSDVRDLLGLSDEAPKAPPSLGTQRDRAISALLSRISVTRTGDSMAMTVSTHDARPDMAARLANSVTGLFVEWSRDLKRDDIKGGVEFLRQQARELASHIAETEQQIADYGRRNDVSSDPRDDLLRGAMQRANEQLSAARGDLTQAQSRLAQIKREAAGDTSGNDPLLTSQFLTTLRNDEATALRDKAQLALNFGTNHPLLQAANAKVESVRDAIAQEMKGIVANLENDVRVAQDRVTKVETDLAASDRELRNRSLAEIKLRELNRDLLTEQKLYDIVASRLGKLDPYSSVADPGARVVSEAETPTEPSFPKPRVVIAGGFVGSLILALAVAMAIESLDSRVRNAKTMASILRVPVLASIPRLGLGIPRLSTDIFAYLRSRPRSAFAEIFRSLHSAYRQSVAGQHGRVVMITSALSAEGRTTTAIGLAHAAASDGMRTVLVDLDRHASNIHKCLKLGESVNSLADYIDGRCGLSDILHAVPEVANLDVLTSRVKIGVPTGRHGFQQLKTLVGVLRDEYDFVVIDAPPLLMVEDASRIAALVDGVILVGACNRTPEEALREARERVGMTRAPLVGAVLNGVDAKSAGNRAYRSSRESRRQLKNYFAN